MKILPSIAYLRVQRQVYLGYSMALAGWIGEYILNYGSLPKPNFIRKALSKLGFSHFSENWEEDAFLLFYQRKSTGVTATWDLENEKLILQVFPLKTRLSKGITIRAEYLEFYNQHVVSIEPAQKLPHGIRSIGINPLIVGDSEILTLPYWGMVHEDWENDLKILVMKDEIFDSLLREEYRCPVCFSPLRREGSALVCDRCGFIHTPEEGLEEVIERFTVEEFSF
ncbi:MULTISPECIES: hypothetical protein [Pyrococcus]|nr:MULTISPECIES: hypothetical protein [Pyrococcus]AAL80473.1 hypothetical protein PF0349 [Pyrococcus furiosus DSM 3638]MDK2869279.1 hypothetical protein [Pyrococcus sp.]